MTTQYTAEDLSRTIEVEQKIISHALEKKEKTGVASLWTELSLSLRTLEYTLLEKIASKRNVTVGNLVHTYIKEGLEKEGKKDPAFSSLTVQAAIETRKVQLETTLKFLALASSKAALLIPQSESYEERLEHEIDQKILATALLVVRKVYGVAPGE